MELYENDLIVYSSVTQIGSAAHRAAVRWRRLPFPAAAAHPRTLAHARTMGGKGSKVKAAPIGDEAEGPGAAPEAAEVPAHEADVGRIDQDASEAPAVSLPPEAKRDGLHSAPTGEQKTTDSPKHERPSRDLHSAPRTRMHQPPAIDENRVVDVPEGGNGKKVEVEVPATIQEEKGPTTPVIDRNSSLEEFSVQEPKTPKHPTAPAPPKQSA
eukprot:4223098-Pleurochrysis_carterae.AAC.1